MGYTERTRMTRQKKIDACSDCKIVGHIYGRGRCRKCYTTWYTSQPHVKERRAAQERERRRKNPERYKAYDVKRGETARRKMWRKRYNREYYDKNAGRLRAYQSTWRKEHPRRRDDYKRAYRARKLGLVSTLTDEEWEDILVAFGYSCAYCGKEDSSLAKEHWIPASLDGGYSADNIVPSCTSCNSMKGTMTGDEYLELLWIQERRMNDVEGLELS